VIVAGEAQIAGLLVGIQRTSDPDQVETAQLREIGAERLRLDL
jgi:hypothetical protein